MSKKIGGKGPQKKICSQNKYFVTSYLEKYNKSFGKFYYVTDIIIKIDIVDNQVDLVHNKNY